MEVALARQWTLIKLVAKTLEAPTDVLMVVHQTVARLAEVGDTPWRVGAYLHVVGTMWQVEIQMNYPYEDILPSGTGRLLFDTTRYGSAEEHFAAALEACRLA